MIVVDLGCKAYEAEASIPRLVAEYNPEILFGFDPHPELEEDVTHTDCTLVVTRRAAAWTSNGTLRYEFDGTRSRACFDGSERVACFDFPQWLSMLPHTGGLVVKLDVEGAEYRLLERMHHLGVDANVELVLVEWHDAWATGALVSAAAEMETRLRCPVEAWL